MVTVLLIRKIVELFLIMLLGYAIVKSEIIQAKESSVLSKLSLYLVVPCVIINSFQIEFTENVKNGLLLAFSVAVAIHFLLIAMAFLAGNFFHADEVEKASIIYSNAGSLVIPIVAAVLGDEWVIYSSAFVTVQMVFVWTHGKILFSKGSKPSFRKIILNVNMISIIVGLLLMLLGIRLPSLVNETMASVGNMIGPIGMLITGMVVAGMGLKQLFLHKRVYLVALLRMIVCPGIILLLLKWSHISSLIPGGTEILLISFLAAAAPAAATVTQFAQIHNKDAEYASAINIITTLSCIVTMPAFVALYYV